MSTQTHHSSAKAKQPKTVAEARVSLDEAHQVERAFRQAAQTAQWTYHRAVTLEPQAEQTEVYRKLHTHAIEQWKAALTKHREAAKDLRRATSAHGARGNRNRSNSLAGRSRQGQR